MSEDSGIMIFGEVRGGKLDSVTTELLGGGRRLALRLGQELFCLLVGSDVAGLAQEVVAFGADKVYVVTDSLLKEYQPDAYLAVTEKVVGQVKPQVFLLGQSDIG
ncbi:MAG: hypothetical protein JW790_03285, partial [Dehalococcoidales bacterium]|nr:hypothetical protein [Dehalococcoidales bacterium]